MGVGCLGAKLVSRAKRADTVGGLPASSLGAGDGRIVVWFLGELDD